LKDFELFDVNEVLPEVPYAQQDAFYHKGQARQQFGTDTAAEDAPATADAGTKTGTTEGW
jgi:hypothetical protein